ncbi:acyl carrier protein phosphodiesterase [Flavobacterium sp.]|uniref:acyl carrier protein phosphodiesterase n=1 Tax=Flavobacterium sp. TaxID=239 RepID=UPI00261AAFF8|nr:acyl carrier protein phosphodiesterase [Flavobacterium sp.]
MNFLAHIFLSGDNDLIKIGNFMADGIRGKHFDGFPEAVRKGILLHREIDTYTDAHPVWRASTRKLHERYHHYAGVIVDVFYDHFLAKNWSQYSEDKLEDFTERFYRSLHQHYDILTEKTKGMMPHMIQRNWLLSYRTIEGMERIFSQMDSRTGNQSNMRFATEELRQYYEDFEQEFTAFFTDLQNFCMQKRDAL